MKKIKLIAITLSFLTAFSLNVFAMDLKNNNLNNNPSEKTNKNIPNNTTKETNKNIPNNNTEETNKNIPNNNTEEINENTPNNNTEENKINYTNDDDINNSKKETIKFNKKDDIFKSVNKKLTEKDLLKRKQIMNKMTHKKNKLDKKFSIDGLDTFSTIRGDDILSEISLISFTTLSPTNYKCNFHCKEYDFEKYWDENFKSFPVNLNDKNLDINYNNTPKIVETISALNEREPQYKRNIYAITKEYYTPKNIKTLNNIKAINIYKLSLNKNVKKNLLKQMSRLIFDEKGFLRIKILYAPYFTDFSHKYKEEYIINSQQKTFAIIYDKPIRYSEFNNKFYIDNAYLTRSDLKNAKVFFNTVLESTDPFELVDFIFHIFDYDNLLHKKNGNGRWCRINLTENDLESIKYLYCMDSFTDLVEENKKLKDGYNKYVKEAKRKIENEKDFEKILITTPNKFRLY